MKSVEHTYAGSPEEHADLILNQLASANPDALTDLLTVIGLMLESSPKLSARQCYQRLSETAGIEVSTRNLLPPSPAKQPEKKVPEKPLGIAAKPEEAPVAKIGDRKL